MWHLECLPPSRESLSVALRQLAWHSSYGHLVNFYDIHRTNRGPSLFLSGVELEGYLIGQIQEETIPKKKIALEVCYWPKSKSLLGNHWVSPERENRSSGATVCHKPTFQSVGEEEKGIYLWRSCRCRVQRSVGVNATWTKLCCLGTVWWFLFWRVSGTFVFSRVKV